MIVVVGLVLAFALVVILGKRRTRNCRWRQDRRGDRDGLRKYRCAFCGAETFTSSGKAPLICMADLPDP